MSTLYFNCSSVSRDFSSGVRAVVRCLVDAAVDGVLRHQRVMKVSVATVAGIYVGYKLAKGPLSYIVDEYYAAPLTWLVSKCSVDLDDTVRKRFREIRFPEARGFLAAHSHPTAAGHRSVADIAISHFIAVCGYRVYSVSPSDADDRQGFDGMRLFYSLKSAVQRARMDKLSPNHIIKMVDVDYYVNMHGWMRYGNPIVMYTFMPLSVGGSVPDGTFTISDDHVEMLVQGGAKYRHQLWDYNEDLVAAHYWWGTYVYSVETVVFPDDHQRRVVALTPRLKIYGPAGWFLSGARTLKRRIFGHDGFNTMRYLTKDGDETVEFMSVSKPGLTYSATLPTAVGATLCARVTNMKRDAPLAILQAALGSIIEKKIYPQWSKKTVPVTIVTLLAEAMGKCPELFDAAIFPIQTLPGQSPHYTVYHKDFVLDEVEHGMRVVDDNFKPVASGGFAPTQCRANDLACIEHRVTKLTNKSRPPQHYRRYAEEFIELLVGDKRHTGVPDDYDEVFEKQNRPSQRSILERAKNWLGMCGKNIVASFQKRESYGKVTAPRNISTLKGDVKMEYSTYLYAFSRELMYTQPWYAFSKTPVEIAERLRDLAEHAKWVVPTDFSRFDGRHSEFLCELEEMALRAFFAPEYHDHATRLQRSQYNTVGYTKFEIQYQTGYTRLSGSPDTSCFNTLDNAFIAYCALRQVYQGLTGKERAWKALGLYGGDDGTTFDIDPELYVDVASKFGEKLVASVVPRGDPIPLLSRFFVEAWYGGLGSYTDVKRQLQKLHLTTAANEVPVFVVLYRKALGYLLTDPLTPVLAAWSRAIVRIVNAEVWALDKAMALWKREITHDQRWFEKYDSKVQFPPPVDVDEMYKAVNRQLGVDKWDWTQPIEESEHHFDQCKTLGDVFDRTWFEEPAVIDVPALVGNDFVEPPKPPVVEPTVPNRTRRGRPPRPPHKQQQRAAPTGSTQTAKSSVSMSQ